MAVKKTKETNTTISEKLEGLFELQNVDSGIDKLQILRGELPLEVSDLEEQIDKLNNHLLDESDNEAKINNLILEQNEKIKNSEALIEKYNKQQMKVRNNREFDAINKELEFQALEIQLANKKITSFESDLEENGGKIKLVKAKIRERKKFLKTKKGELDVIVKSTEKDEAKFNSQKKKISKGIEDRLINIYENLRTTSKNGLAVVQVDRGACGGCFSSITAQHNLNIKLRKDILFCENCGRILVPDDIVE
ncbi:MAG: hypothetical protein CMD26_00880 [Flavobacteriales bacterium]|nr:hypothetical protein [Flavobacteriales bacterium]|tara:strand:+ start:3704 stop:4456 length:753 start_codon:yes stop_codon:yes gene_type:complete